MQPQAVSQAGRAWLSVLEVQMRLEEVVARLPVKARSVTTLSALVYFSVTFPQASRVVEAGI